MVISKRNNIQSCVDLINGLKTNSLKSIFCKHSKKRKKFVKIIFVIFSNAYN